MNKLYMAMAISIIGHIVGWFYMQAQFRWDIARSLPWIIFGGIQTSIFFYYGTRWYYEYFGDYWYIRPIGFGMATITFGVLTWLVLGGTPDFKTWISIVLSAIIIVIQLS